MAAAYDAKTLAQAEKLGGKTVVPPQEVPGMGWFTIFKDPQGAMLALWQAKSRS